MPYENDLPMKATSIALALFSVALLGSLQAEERGPIVLTDAARAIHSSALVIDGHNDLPWELRDQGSPDFKKLDIAQQQSSLHTDLPRLKQGGVGGQFWSVWVPVSTSRRGAALSTTLEQIELVKLMLRQYPGELAAAYTADDIERLQNQGKIASLIGVEGGHCIEESIPVLRRLYQLGARYMTLTHSDTLSWADSATDEKRNGGLTEFGLDVVAEMNRLGMMVDLSHVSAEVMRQAITASEAPVMFSHSSCRAVAAHPRNVPDDILKMLPEKDGVVMINFFSAFVVPEAAKINVERLRLQRLSEEKHTRPDGTLDEDAVDAEMDDFYDKNPMPRGTIHHVLDHIDHVKKVAGIDHIGLGSDYDGVSMLPEQLDDVTSYPYLTQGMLDRGYTAGEIRKVLGGNLLRVMRKAEAVSKASKSK